MTHSLPLPRVLALDAITCLVAGAGMAAGAELFSPPTGLPVEVLRYAGLALLPVAAFFGWLSRVRPLPVGLVQVAVGGNLAWVAGSLILVAVLEPALPGLLFVLAQASAVLVLALAEWRGALALRQAAACP